MEAIIPLETGRGLALCAFTVGVIIANSLCLLLFQRPHVGTKFLYVLRRVYIFNIIWQAFSIVYLFFPLNEYTEILGSCRYYVGVGYVLVNGLYNITIVDSFHMLTLISRNTAQIVTTFAFIFTGLVATAKTVNLVYCTETTTLIHDVTVVIFAACFTLADSLKSIYILYVLYVDALRAGKENNRQKEDISRSYSKLNKFFLLHFIATVFGLAIWIVGVFVKKEEYFKTAEIIYGFAICAYPKKVIAFRELRFEKKLNNRSISIPSSVSIESVSSIQ